MQQQFSAFPHPKQPHNTLVNLHMKKVKTISANWKPMLTHINVELVFS
jgi:hypothetical protein